jgi:hypothetical protein
MEEFLKVSQLGVNGLLLFALYKIWTAYQESQKAYVVLLERCIQVLTNVTTGLAELKDK